MNINKFSDNLDNPFHSNGYAKAARGNEIGSMSPQSFNQRMHIEKNRSSVRKYHDSMLVHAHHREGHNFSRTSLGQSERVMSDIIPRKPLSRVKTRRTVGPLITDITKPASRQGFSEPPSRGFNPYK